MAEEKILNEEVIDDADLENVAGGSWGETINDFQSAVSSVPGFFDNLKGRENKAAVVSYFNSHRAEAVGQLKNMFAKYGINVEYDLSNSNSPTNKYTKNGQAITQSEAWMTVVSQTR